MQTPRSSSKSSKTDQNALILVGEVSKVHGVRGAFIVSVDTSMKDVLAPGTRIYLDSRGRRGQDKHAPKISDLTRLEIETVSGHGPGLRVTTRGLGDRSAAEALIGRLVLMPREQLPDPGNSTYYDVDLIGLRVITDRGDEVGELAEVLGTSANDVYVVRTTDAGEVLIAAVAANILSVDIAAGSIVVHHECVQDAGQPA